MRKVAVIGVGVTKVGKFPERRAEDLGAEAVWKAIEDSRVSPNEIQVAYHGNMGAFEQTDGHAILERVGIRGIPVTNIREACASSSVAFREAWLSIASGLYDIALAFGTEKMSGRPGGTPIPMVGAPVAALLGLTFSGSFGLIAVRHMHLYGTTLEQMAMVSVKNHKNAIYNPHAQYPMKLSISQVLESRMVSYPLTLLQCSPISDGASAAILVAEEIAKRYTDTPIKIAASVQTSLPKSSDFQEITTFPNTVLAAREAYEVAKTSAKDIDVAEVHDCFSIAEILHYEDLGFCSKGYGGKFIEEGQSEIGGTIAVNTSGGLLAKGHPVGATGVAQVAEIVWQLRGEAGKRQVSGAKIGLTHCMGAPHSCVVNVLKR